MHQIEVFYHLLYMKSHDYVQTNDWILIEFLILDLKPFNMKPFNCVQRNE